MTGLVEVREDAVRRIRAGADGGDTKVPDVVQEGEAEEDMKRWRRVERAALGTDRWTGGLQLKQMPPEGLGFAGRRQSSNVI